MEASRAVSVAEPRKPFYTHLYVQVLTAIVLGILLGHFYPQLGEQMKPLGDGFVKMIKMLIAPIIFCTVVHGIASMEDMKKVGRVGLKALVYFEVLTTLALIVGLIVVNVLQPGAGMNVDPRALDTRSIQVYTTKAGQQSTVEFLMHIIPNTVIGAFESPHLTSAGPFDTWTLLSATGVAPAGTVNAQIVVVHVQLNNPVTGGAVYFDDASLGVTVPEPTIGTMGLMLCGGIVLRRRTKN